MLLLTGARWGSCAESQGLTGWSRSPGGLRRSLLQGLCWKTLRDLCSPGILCASRLCLNCNRSARMKSFLITPCC